MFYKDSLNIYRVTELDAFPGWCTASARVKPTSWRSSSAWPPLKQIHSAACVAAGGRSGVLGQGDALLEDTPGAVVAVKTADCVPILLVDERRRAVAAVHAGWRGTAARHCRQSGGRHGAGASPRIRRICMPPSARPSAPAATRSDPRWREQFGEPGRTHLDLPAINRRQFLEAGVTDRANLRVELMHHVPARGVSFVPPGPGSGRPALFVRGNRIGEHKRCASRRRSRAPRR